MPAPIAFAPLLWGAFLTIISGVVFRVLVALGIGFVTYNGVDTLQDSIKSEIISAFEGLPPQVYQLAGYMGFGTCINIILSAIAIRFVMKGLGTATGAITAMVFMGKSDT